MAYIRKRPALKKRAYRKRGGGMRRMKTNRYATHTYAFKRWAEPVYLTNNVVEDPTKIVTSDPDQLALSSTISDIGGVLGTYEFGGVFTPKLDNVINTAEFTNLFDQYQIAGVKFTITPLKNVNTASSNAYLPELCISRDLDDVLVPISDVELLQRQDLRIRRLTRPVSVYCKPGVLLDQAGTGANIVPFGTVRRNLFIDSATSDIVHPAFKWWMRNVPFGPVTGAPQPNTFAVRIDTCYYLKMKNVR